MKKGVVKFYDSEKGFGFVEGDDGNEYLVHRLFLQDKSKALKEGQIVTFNVSEDGYAKKNC